MILNLKRLNKYVGYKQYKMESLQNVSQVYVASIDLKDIFYSIPARKGLQAFLTFFVEEYLKFVCMPSRYKPAMQI